MGPLSFLMLDVRYTNPSPDCGEAETAAEFIAWLRGQRVPLNFTGKEVCNDPPYRGDPCSPPGYSQSCVYSGVNTYNHDCLTDGPFLDCGSDPWNCNNGLPFGTPWEASPCQPRPDSQACAMWLAVNLYLNPIIRPQCPPPPHENTPQISFEVMWDYCLPGGIFEGGTGITLTNGNTAQLFASGCAQIAEQMRRSAAQTWIGVPDGQFRPFEYDFMVEFEEVTDN